MSFRYVGVALQIAGGVARPFGGGGNKTPALREAVVAIISVMTSKILLGTALLLFTALGQCRGYAFGGRSQKNREREAKLLAKIEREKNPGKRARLQLRLARIKLQAAINSYNHDNFEKGLSGLREYRDLINASWNSLQNSRRGVSKHLRAYMALEIRLREDGRLLTDLRHQVPYPENEAIAKIEKENREVHRQVLGVLFPPGRPREKSPKPRRSSFLLSARPVVQG